jgi:hypothetical protein
VRISNDLTAISKSDSVSLTGTNPPNKGNQKMKLQTMFMILKKDKTDRDFRVAWHHDFTTLKGAELRIQLLRIDNPVTEYKVIEVRKHNHNIC